MGVTVTVEDPATSADVLRIQVGLDAFNRAAGLTLEHRPVHVVLRADGVVAGGLLGGTGDGWLMIGDLWVRDDLRGHGHGAALLAAAEAIAAARGCVGSWVDTFTFQAPGFYRKQGYTEFGRLHDFPPGAARVFLSKRLTPGAPPRS